jgi:hypothetical protein
LLTKEIIEKGRQLNVEHEPRPTTDRLDSYRSIKILTERSVLAYREVETNVANLVLILGPELKLEDIKKIHGLLYANMTNMFQISEVIGQYESKYNDRMKMLMEQHRELTGEAMAEPPELKMVTEEEPKGRMYT